MHAEKSVKNIYNCIIYIDEKLKCLIFPQNTFFAELLCSY